MTKTVKTFINTSLLMLFVSHTHGLVFNISDRINLTGATSTLLLDNTTSGFNGIDDTFDGRVTFNFSINFGNFLNGGAFAGLALVNSDGDSPITVGNSWSSLNWNGFRIKNSLLTTTLDFGTNAVVQGTPKAFTMTINYNAGALDTGTLTMAGDSTTYDIGDFDYSFDEIYFRSGSAATLSVSATDMSVSIVPEPATYALIFGALAIGFVALRRRFNA